MTPEQAAALTRMIWRQRLRAAIVPAVGILGVAIAVGLSWLKVPLSTAYSDCTFVRWTVGQTNVGPASTVIYCDLDDGRTIMASAGTQWMPPAPGTRMRIEVQHLMFGTRYVVENSAPPWPTP